MVITPQHWQEWKDSAVDDDIIRLNVLSLEGRTALEYLFYSDKLPRRNDGRLRDRELKKYGHAEKGGWWCSGEDVINGGGESQWGCFKPNKPRLESKGFGKEQKERKRIKYEHPPKADTEIFALRVSWKVGLRVAKRYGHEEAYRQRLLQAHSGHQPTETLPTIESSHEKTFNGAWSDTRASRRNNQNPAHTASQTGQGETNSSPSQNFLSTEDRGFWRWVIEMGIPVVITEGAKKAGALLTAGYAAIALPGVWNGRRQPKDELGNKIAKPYLIPQLQPFATKGREISFCFDNDPKPKTVANVSAAIAQTGILFAYKGCQVKIITWQHPEKGVDDLIASRGEDAFNAAYEAALCLPNWQAKQYTKLTYEAARSFNQRYLGKFLPPEEAKLIALKAPKGTGKTEWLAAQVEKAIRNGQRVLVLTYRIQLGEALCSRFGVDYVSEFRSSETQGVFGYGLCVDSLHANSQAQFNPDEWQDALIIVDECESVFWHLLNSSTCYKQRVPILRNLKQLIQNALSSEEGKIYLSSADLSDNSIDYVRGLAESPIQPWVVVNEWQNPDYCWDVTAYEGNDPRSLVKELVKDISRGGIPLVCTSAQKAKSKWGTKNIEAYLKKRFPDKRILRIDSESVADPDHEAYACIPNLNEILPEYDIVICSPSIETGVSIDVQGHFTSCWGIAQGGIPENSVRQQLARLREPVPRHLWAAQRGIGKIGNGSTSVNALQNSQHKATKANIQLLIQSGFDDIDQNFQGESLKAWAKFACRINLGMMAYRDAIIEGLKAEGHRVSFYGENSSDDTTEKTAEEIKQTCDEGYQAECQEVAAADNPDDKMYQSLKEKRSKTKQERLSQRKGQLCRRYEVETTSSLVAKDDEGWYSQLGLHYSLTVGRQYLEKRDRRRLDSQLDTGLGALWKPDFNRSQLVAQVRMLEELGIPQLLQRERTTASDLEDMAEKVFAHAWEIKSVLNLNLTENSSPVQIAQALLDKLDYKMPYLGRFGSKDNRQRVYGAAVPISDPIDRSEIFQKWWERDYALAEKEAAQSGYLESLVSTPSKYRSTTNPQDTLGVDTTQDTSNQHRRHRQR
jgi:hypothetical protein